MVEKGLPSLQRDKMDEQRLPTFTGITDEKRL
jgi:hypothetical protein